MTGAPENRIALSPLGHAVTIKERNRRVLRVLFDVPRGSPVLPLHMHPFQVKRVTICAGEFLFWIDGKPSRPAVGETVEIMPHVWHGFRLESTAADGQLELEFRPQLRSAAFYWLWSRFHAARILDTKTGLPSGLSGTLLAARYADEFQFVHPWLMPFVRLLGVLVSNKRSFTLSQYLLATLGFGFLGLAVLVLLARVASTGCKELDPGPLVTMICAAEDLRTDSTTAPAASQSSGVTLVKAGSFATSVGTAAQAAPAGGRWWDLILGTPDLFGQALRHSATAMTLFTGLLLLGLSFVGWWRVRDIQSDTEAAIPVGEPSRERSIRSTRKRFWFEGTNFFPAGVRAAFLIPLSLTAWLGIMKAAEVVGERVGGHANAAALVQSKWTMAIVLLVAIWLGWAILWPGEPDDDSFKLSREERDALEDAIVATTTQNMRHDTERLRRDVDGLSGSTTALDEKLTRAARTMEGMQRTVEDLATHVADLQKKKGP